MNQAWKCLDIRRPEPVQKANAEPLVHGRGSGSLKSVQDATEPLDEVLPALIASGFERDKFRRQRDSPSARLVEEAPNLPFTRLDLDALGADDNSRGLLRAEYRVPTRECVLERRNRIQLREPGDDRELHLRDDERKRCPREMDLCGWRTAEWVGSGHGGSLAGSFPVVKQSVKDNVKQRVNYSTPS